MKKKRNVAVCGIIVWILLLAADQITKYLAQLYLKGTSGIPLLPGVFELFYLENRGAAFGMMTDRQWFFILVALAILVLAVWFFRKLPTDSYFGWMRFLCVLIGAGAVGNMIDRIVYGYVTDFLYFKAINFPVFNVADCYVCIGALLTVILLFTKYKNEHFEFLFHHKGEK